MKTPVWIAVLILAMVQTAQAQQERVVQVPQNVTPVPVPKRTGGEEVRRDKAQQPKGERLSPEERLKLRQDINEAGRDIYRRERRS